MACAEVFRGAPGLRHVVIASDTLVLRTFTEFSARKKIKIMDPLRLTYSLKAFLNTIKGKISYHNFIFYFCLQSVKCLIIYMYEYI